MSEGLKQLAEDFAENEHTLFPGRGPMWPVAMEGALKLKEILYIHAEAYAAGELKHVPLALIDEDMPVVVVAPNNELLDKLKSNMQVVRARGGQAGRTSGAANLSQVWTSLWNGWLFNSGPWALCLGKSEPSENGYERALQHG